ncbi:hypothetical protein SAMN04515663_1019 [Alcanivorax sp. DSM 26293]|uniref:hypothetical protein n=1 Tax=Alcanivorax sp. DSM 26293 TaxID=1798238 RepID=UPI0008A01683|nr:hypothetical protein [Alcanivorax sp. DSM 26293]SEF38610.1 hypothetical protein SAMN04515663_1019 [Alcanivorax sp. DSM 26293]|tara:strand:+ start:182 stop:784 length:603 start_codon:yes stop_codon:yes gene_type:complete
MIVVVFLTVVVVAGYVFFSLIRCKKRGELIRGMGFSKKRGAMFSVDNISIKGWRSGGAFERVADEGVYGVSDIWVFKGVGRYSGVSQVTVLYFFCPDWDDDFEVRRKRVFETKWEQRSYQSFRGFPDLVFKGLSEEEAVNVLEDFSRLSCLGPNLIVKSVSGYVFSYFEGTYIKNSEVQDVLNEFYLCINSYISSKGERI